MMIVLAPAALEEIARLCAVSPGAETGGVLIGEVRGNEAHVEAVSGPGPNAVCLARRLDWDASYVEGVIHGVALSVVLQVLGRWHKHAAPIILPSEDDRRGAEWFRQCVAPEDSTVELIVACDENDAPMAFGAFQCTKDEGMQRITMAIDEMATT